MEGTGEEHFGDGGGRDGGTINRGERDRRMQI